MYCYKLSYDVVMSYGEQSDWNPGRKHYTAVNLKKKNKYFYPIDT